MNNRLTTTLAAGLLASAGLCASALAQEKPAPPAKTDKVQVAPGKQQDPKAEPATVEKLDDNAQRIHDRDRAAKPPGSAASNVRTTTAPTAQASRGVPEGVRDWAAIDKNKDNLISPEEMEAALKEGAPSAAPAAPAPPAKQ